MHKLFKTTLSFVFMADLGILCIPYLISRSMKTFSRRVAGESQNFSCDFEMAHIVLRGGLIFLSLFLSIFRKLNFIIL